MKKFHATLKGQEVLVLEVSLDKERALVAIPSKDGGPSRLKVVPLGELDLDTRQLFILRMGIRDDVN